MKSINIDLEKHLKKGLLKFHASRPTLYGLEMHLVVFHKLIKEFKPKVVVLDPITNLVTVGDPGQVKSILIRLIDFLQKEQITAMFTALSFENSMRNSADEDVSSLVDTWISVHDLENNGERNREIYVIKSRGMRNSNQVREFRITDDGIKIVDVVLGPDGVLIGSAREQYNLEKDARHELRRNALDQKNRQIENKKSILNAKIAELTSEFELAKAELNRVYKEDELRKEATEKNRSQMTRMRENKGQNTKTKK
jgi:circadian clock protein KaiC